MCRLSSLFYIVATTSVEQRLLLTLLWGEVVVQQTAVVVYLRTCNWIVGSLVHLCRQ